MKPGKLGICVYRYIVHNAKRFRRIGEELRVLEGTLLEGGQEEGQSKHGHNAVWMELFESAIKHDQGAT